MDCNFYSMYRKDLNKITGIIALNIWKKFIWEANWTWSDLCENIYFYLSFRIYYTVLSEEICPCKIK